MLKIFSFTNTLSYYIWDHEHFRFILDDLFFLLFAFLILSRIARLKSSFSSRHFLPIIVTVVFRRFSSSFSSCECRSSNLFRLLFSLSLFVFFFYTHVHEKRVFLCVCVYHFDILFSSPDGIYLLAFFFFYFYLYNGLWLVVNACATDI